VAQTSVCAPVIRSGVKRLNSSFKTGWQNRKAASIQARLEHKLRHHLQTQTIGMNHCLTVFIEAADNQRVLAWLLDLVQPRNIYRRRKYWARRVGKYNRTGTQGRCRIVGT